MSFLDYLTQCIQTVTSPITDPCKMLSDSLHAVLHLRQAQAQEAQNAMWSDPTTAALLYAGNPAAVRNTGVTLTPAGPGGLTPEQQQAAVNRFQFAAPPGMPAYAPS